MDDSGDEPRVRDLSNGNGSPEQAKLMARTIAGVTEDIEAMRFNTSISKLMVCVRDITRNGELFREEAEKFVLLLSPLAPHLAEELWNQLGHAESLAYESWPEVDGDLLEDEKTQIVIQVNGKKRDELEVDKSLSLIHI